MSKKIQTPVEWLSNQINTAKWKFADITDRNKIISEAIEMEKQYKQKLADDAFRLGLETGKVFKSIEL